MAQADYIVSNGTGAAVRSDINGQLAAIVSNNSGATSPATTYAYQWWADTTTNTLKLRNSANSAWIEIMQLDGTLTMESGTAALPGLAFRDDLDTGIFRAGTNQLGISSAGVERVEFGSSEVVFNDAGNNYDFRVEGDTNANLLFVDASTDRVGVGTSSPSGTLEVGAVAGTVTAGDLIVTTGSTTATVTVGRISSTSADSTSFRVRNRVNSTIFVVDAPTERVGIGTSSPGYTLDVAGAGRHFSSTTDSASLYLSKTNSGTADQGGNKIYFTNAGPVATGRASGTLIGALQFQASQPTSGSLQNCGAIEITADSFQSGLFTPTKLQFSTASTSVSGSNVVAMTIDSSQRVGIGDTAPSDKVTIAGGASGSYGLTINNSQVGGGTKAYFQYNATNEIANLAGNTTNGLAFYTLTGGSLTEKARLDPSGRLLLGTSTAGAMLTVKNDSAAQSPIATTSVSGDLIYQAILVTKFDNNTTTSQNFIQFQVNNGSANCGRITANGANTAAFGSTSDIRLKENVEDLPPQLQNILSLRPVEFDYIESEGGGHQIGFIAQEMQAIYPDVVNERGEDDMLMITGWSKTEARLVKALQEAVAKIETLEARLTAAGIE